MIVYPGQTAAINILGLPVAFSWSWAKVRRQSEWN